MGIVIKCKSGHEPSSYYGETKRELVRAFAQFGTMKACPARKGRCGEDRNLLVVHKAPGKLEHTYTVIAVRPVYTSEAAEYRGRDPMVFLLHNRDSGEYGLWTYYWIKDRNGDWANGQFPPLFLGEEAEQLRASINDMRRLMREKEKS